MSFGELPNGICCDEVEINHGWEYSVQLAAGPIGCSELGGQVDCGSCKCHAIVSHPRTQ